MTTTFEVESHFWNSTTLKIVLRQLRTATLAIHGPARRKSTAMWATKTRLATLPAEICQWYWKGIAKNQPSTEALTSWVVVVVSVDRIKSGAQP
jgi:hypothetical protein